MHPFCNRTRVFAGVNNFSLALHNNERKALYYALRHAQIPVDFLSEDDVIDGRAKDYKLIYVTQQYLHSKCVDSLQKWCEAGGFCYRFVFIITD